MAFILAIALLSFSLISGSIPLVLSSTIIEELNRPPPSEFHIRVLRNCRQNPSLRYCSAAPSDLSDIFKSTIVARHLCNESKNTNCSDPSFTKIDLSTRPLIAPLYLSFSFFWKYCPLTILTINLSKNSLEGSFPTDILYCSQIQHLDLSYNKLVGELPIDGLTLLTNLTSLDLSYNHFEESNISEIHYFRKFNSSSFLHSGLLLTDQKFDVRSIALLVLLPIFVVGMVGCCGWMCLQRPDLLPSVLQRKHKFTKAMLKVATEGFAARHLKRRNGKVEIYGGFLRDGTEVLIEIHREVFSYASRQDFIEECRILVQLDHKNLVQMLGWCDNKEFRAVVKRWIDSYTIVEWLSRNPPWKHRLKVLTGVIGAMCYLQDHWPQVGYDIRTSSIYLSHDREPLISRFKVQDKNNTSKKVYKLGLLSLELVANKHPVEGFERGETGFVEWIKLHYPTHVPKVIDERMKVTTITFEQVKQTIGIGLMCTDISNHQPPSLRHIWKVINQVHQSSLVSESPVHHHKIQRTPQRMQSMYQVIDSL